MRRLLCTFSFFSLFLLQISDILGQVAPFSLPPRWHFGHRGGMNFTGGAPVLLNGNVWDAGSYSNQENTTSECLPSGALHYYSNSCIIANGTNTNFGPNPLNGGGNSSTQGCVSIPNPASPTNSYYLITTDVDPSGGSDCSSPDRGVWAYSINATPAVVGAPTELSPEDRVGEVIAATSDNADGYWILSHGGLVSTAALSTYYAWHVDNAGVINTTPVTSTGTFAALEFKDQAGIKINRCNTRLAYINGQNLEVMTWNPTTGAIGPSIATRNVNTAPSNSNWLYGVEFSPNGNMVYLSDYQGGLYHYEIATNTLTVLSTDGAGSSPGFGNLQLGPDGKIYVAQKYGPGETGPKYLGVISNPDNAAGTCGYVQTGAGAFQLAASGSQFQNANAGLISLGWHNPALTIIESGSPCESFSYTYNQYYGASIAVLAASQEWDFGDGGGWETGLGATPTHTYATNGSKTVKLRLKDQVCQNFYTTQKTINVSCVLPVSLISFDAEKSGASVALTWATATEHNNSHFDVQRSDDGVNFTTIGSVNGRGNSSTLVDYAYTDHFPSQGVNYYRLVQSDFDGTSETSNTVSVSFNSTQVVVFPNPTFGDFNARVTGGKDAHISVSDVLGRMVYTRSISENDVRLTFGNDLPKGIYILNIHTADESRFMKIEKE